MGLCHARNCNWKGPVTWAFGGYFCNVHIKELAVIRKKINSDKFNPQFRNEEVDFRKIVCKGHKRFMSMCYKYYH